MNFSFSELNKKNFEDQKKYVTKYFIPLTNGAHCMLEKGKYKQIDDKNVKSVYFRRMDKKLVKYYFEEYTGIKNVVYEIGKDLFYDDNINLCPQLPTYKPYKDFSQSTRDKAQIFLDYMDEILCNRKIDQFVYLTKYISNMCKGNKNDCALVLKTTLKGVGKTTLPQMIKDHILGSELCLECNSEPLKGKFNDILGGKLFVWFEEVPTFTKNEWMAVDSVLKRQITSKNIILEKKGHDAYEARNINNYMLLSNHDIADEDRRYNVIDVQTHRLGDVQYWNNIYDNCFNDDVGSCLYAYFFEIDTTGFHPQSYPITTNKSNSITKRLDSVFLFLKNEYLLKGGNICKRLTELYEEYKTFCTTLGKKASSKLDFTTKLSELQINHYQSGGFLKYKVSLEQLKELAVKHKWLNELDEYQNNTDDKESDGDECPPNPLDYGLDIKPEATKLNTKEYEHILSINEKLLEENKKLMEKIEKLKKLTTDRKLADGNIYNYDSDDDKEDEKLSLDELDLICKSDGEIALDKEIEKLLDAQPSEKKYRSKKNKNIIVK
jgi:hypothetical protein